MILPHDYVTVTRIEDGELVTVAQLGAAEAVGIISHDLNRSPVSEPEQEIGPTYGRFDPDNSPFTSPQMQEIGPTYGRGAWRDGEAIQFAIFAIGVLTGLAIGWAYL